MGRFQNENWAGLGVALEFCYLFDVAVNHLPPRAVNVGEAFSKT